jgi:cytochrome c oxidase cbb3-type subunit 3/ubiquinol-cytochrome c reductase cytochrome c subunit
MLRSSVAGAPARCLAALVVLVALASAVGVAGCKPRVDDASSSGDAAPESGTRRDRDASAVGSAAAAGRDAAPPAPDPAVAIARGKLLYGRYCNFCHGEGGVGYAADQAPRLANDDLLTLASDDFLREAIVKGRPGTTMSPWSMARGGPLGYEDASAIVAYLRTWQKGPLESTEARKVDADGSAERGASTYAAQCAKCHGKQGKDGKYGALANPELLAAATDGYLATTIERGRDGTPMPSFRGKLTTAQIDDVVALLRSWKRPPDETPPLPPRPGELANIVTNPQGPQPAFEAKTDYIKVDDVKKQLDRHATMIIVDARPPSDYARMHIAGAISVPFYEVEAYAKQLPKDRYILSYCGCPHAESGKVRDALRVLGYPRTAVIDEGLLAWRDRGYPVRGGPKP